MTAQIIQTNICESCLDIKKKSNGFFILSTCPHQKTTHTKKKKKKKKKKKMEKYYFTNVLRHTHKRASGDVCCVYIYIYRVPLSSYFVWLFVVCPMIEFFFYQQLLPAGMIYSRCSACYRSVVHLYVGDSIQ